MKTKIAKPVAISKLLEYYSDMIDLSLIFNHDIVDEDGAYRWRQNRLMRHLCDDAPFYEGMWRRETDPKRGKINMNNMRIDLREGRFSLEEYMKFYMQIGYSLGGYAETFGSCEVTDLGVPYFGKKPPKNWDHDESYYQTPIEYMNSKHNGTVLKL